jgi:1-acyl-sn-glycerol-3-phosphate acyltransferase
MGSVAGGVVGYWLAHSLGSRGLLAAAPLITERMAETAGSWLSVGPPGLMRQPLSGIPYKVFAFIAGDKRLSFGDFLLFSTIARSLRIFAVGGSAGLLGAAAGRERTARFYDLFLIALTALFLLALWRVVVQFS